MDVAITSLFAPILDKLARQDPSDGVLFSFLKEVAGKYSVKQSRAIKQPDPQSRTDNTGNDPNFQNIFIEFKKLYRDILRDQSYKNDYKLFLKKILDRDLLESAGKKEQLDLIPGVDKPLLVVIDGLTKKGAEDFKDKLFKNLFKDLNVSLSDAIKKGFTSIKKEEQGLLEDLLDAVPDFSFGIPGFGGGGRNRRRPKPPRKKPSPRPRPPRGRGRVPIPPILPGSAPKPAPVPKGAPPIPTPKPAPVPKGAPPIPTPKPAPVPKGAPPIPKVPGGGIGGALGKVGGLLGKLALPIMTLYEAGTNLSDSIAELSEKKTLSPSQKVATGTAALGGGAADLVTTIFDPTSWGIDKMFGYDIFGEGALKELLNVIGAKKEDQTMGESLRERTTEMFESFNDIMTQQLTNANLTPEEANAVLGKKEQESWLDYMKPSATGLIAPSPASMLDLITRGIAAYEFSKTPVSLKEGGLVMPQGNKPTLASIAEPGNPEVVTPVDKLFDAFQTTLNTDSLDEIASNTKDTNKALGALADAIIRMVTAFNQKTTAQGGTTIINAGGSQQTTSASMAANLNSDPIRRVRSQFMS